MQKEFAEASSEAGGCQEVTAGDTVGSTRWGEEQQYNAGGGAGWGSKAQRQIATLSLR